MHGEACLTTNIQTLILFLYQKKSCGLFLDPPLDYTVQSSRGECSEVWVQNPSPLLSVGQDVGEATSCLKAVGETLLPFSDI